MKRLGFLLFLALTSQVYGSPFGGAGGLSSVGSTGGLSSNAVDFSDGRIGPVYNGEVGGGGASGGYNLGYTGGLEAGLPGGPSGATTGAGYSFGAGGVDAVGGSSGYGGSYGERHSVGSPGGTLGGIVGVGTGSGNDEFGGVAAGSPVGSFGAFAGTGVQSGNSDSLAHRRQRARVAGAVVGTALGGLVLGGLIAHLAKLGREGRLGHFRSSSYGSYDLGYGYSNDYGSRMAYRGYRRRCNNGRCRQRTCVGLQCH